MQIRLMRRLAILLAVTTTLAAPVSARAAAGGEAADAGSLSGAYLAAKAAQLSGDLKAATNYYAQALGRDPTSEDLQKDAMFAFLANGQFREGVELAAKLRDDPDSGKVARIALGVDALAKGKFGPALEEFDILEPSDLDALLLGHLSAWSEAGAGRIDEALERIKGLDKASWYPVFNDYQAGLIAGFANRLDVARTALNRVIADKANAQTSPDAFLSAAEALARLEMRDGRKKEALAALDKGLELAPNYDPLVQLKARIERGETVEAPLASVKAGAAETLYTLGQAINRGEGQQVAILYFQLAQALDAGNPSLLMALAGIAERAERYDDAIAYYAKIPADAPLRRTADLQTGLDLWSADRKDEAKAHLLKAVETYPDDLQAYLALADILNSSKDYPGMAKALDRAVEIAQKQDTDSWNIHYQRGIAFERMKEWPKAEADFRKALEMSPNQPQVLNYLGYSWVDMNMNLDEGLKMIRTAVDLRPNDGYIIDSLGWAYYRLARYDEAVEQLERAVLLTPVDPTINDHLGDAYWRVGREREARFQWQRALVGEPKPEAGDVARIEAKLKDGLPAETRKADMPGGEPKRVDPKDERADNSKPGAPLAPAAR